MPKISRKGVLGAAAAALLAAGGAGAAAAAGTGGGFVDDEQGPLTGEVLQRASDVALAETGGGRVTGSEAGDEDSYYEVEVTLDDGRRIDVQLDESFAVVGGAADAGSPGDDGG